MSDSNKRVGLRGSTQTGVCGHHYELEDALTNSPRIEWRWRRGKVGMWIPILFPSIRLPLVVQILRKIPAWAGQLGLEPSNWRTVLKSGARAIAHPAHLRLTLVHITKCVFCTVRLGDNPNVSRVMPLW